MERGEGKDQKSGNLSQPSGVGVSDGFIPQFSQVFLSQCVKCKKNLGGSSCSHYGIKPRRYQLHSCGLRCPQRDI